MEMWLIGMVVRYHLEFWLVLPFCCVTFLLSKIEGFRGRAILSVLLGLIGCFFFWTINTARPSEHGRWVALGSDAKTSELVAFLTSFPDSDHTEALVTRLRDKQTAHMREDMTAVSRTLLEALLSQPIPTTLQVKISGDHEYSALGGQTVTSHYDTALVNFREQLATQLEELIAPVAAAINLSPPDGDPDGVVFAVHYVADPGGPYKELYSGHQFTAIGLSAEWFVFLPRSEQPIIEGQIARAEPPAKPGWEGAKQPEQVVGDVVVEKVLSDFAVLLDHEASVLGMSVEMAERLVRELGEQIGSRPLPEGQLVGSWFVRFDSDLWTIVRRKQRLFVRRSQAGGSYFDAPLSESTLPSGRVEFEAETEEGPGHRFAIEPDGSLGIYGTNGLHTLAERVPIQLIMNR